MKLTQTNYQAFVPMLEQWFKTNIEVSNPSPLISYYREVVNENSYPKDSELDSICIGLQDYDQQDYLVITKVSEVIELIKDFHRIISGKENESPSFYSHKVYVCKPVILTTLHTHVKELEKAVDKFGLGVAVTLIKFDSGNCLPDIGEEPVIFKYLLRDKVLINPDSNFHLNDLITSKAFIKYKEDCFSPSEDNYSNEFDELYHLANLFKVSVYSAISSAELSALKSQLI